MMAREVIKTLVPVALVVGLGLAWAAVRPDFFWQDDFQTQYLPASREIARALSAGELPILSRSSWFGAGLAAEFQHGVFSISTLAIDWLVWQLGLSLPGTATALSLYQLSVLAAGAFQLARARKLDVAEATLVALIAALNGWIVFWGRNWYPAVTSFAWVPWAWWALERSLERRRAGDVLLAGVFIYLILAAGWPFSALMVALLSVCLVLRGWFVTRKLVAPWPAAVAWLIGLGLAAPALMMFIDYGQISARVTARHTFDSQWMMPFDAVRGLILPTVRATWHAYQGALNTRPCAELAGGVVPVCVLLCTFARRELPRAARFDLAIALLALLGAALPCVRPFQSSFRWLPLAHLSLALAAGSCLPTLRGFRSAAPALLAAVLLAVLIALGENSALAKWSLGFALAWAALSLVGRLGGWPAVAFCVANLIATYHFIPPLADAPRWALSETMREQAPYRADVRYLSLFDISDLIRLVERKGAPAYWQGRVASLRPGYTAMYADLQFGNGYSAMAPVGPARLMQFGLHSEINHYHATTLLRVESAEGGLLDLMAIDGLVLVDSLLGELKPLVHAGWKPTARVDEGTVFERTHASRRVRSLPYAETVTRIKDVTRRFRKERGEGPAPIMIFGQTAGEEAFTSATLGELHEDRLHSRVEVTVPAGDQSALVMFSRPWLPGWHASLNGERLRVHQVDMLMPAVKLPPGSHGELLLEYRPAALTRGLWIALATLVLALLWLTRGPRLLAWARGSLPGLRRTPM